MFIWNKNGNKLVKTEDIKAISLEDESKQEEGGGPVTQGEVYILRAYYTVDEQKDSVILASYDSIEIARKQFAGLICAIGQGANVFSLCGDSQLSEDEKFEPEKVLEMEP